MPDDLEMCIKETAHFPRNLGGSYDPLCEATRRLEHAATVTVGPRIHSLGVGG
jgi:hypothetical protein